MNLFPDLQRGYKSAFLLTLFWIVSAIPFSYAADKKYGPYIAAAFGCFALSIAVQQIYIYGVNIFSAPRKNIYFWSSLTLFSFGGCAVLSSIPNMIGLIQEVGIVKNYFLASDVLFVFGMWCIFRLCSTLLFYDNDDVTSRRLLTVFEWSKRNVYTSIEQFHVIVMLAMLGLVLSGFLKDGGVYSQDEWSRVASGEILYFTLDGYWESLIVIGGAITFLSIAYLYRVKYLEIREGEKLNRGILFFQATVLIYFIPSVFQIIVAMGLTGYDTIISCVIVAIVACFLWLGINSKDHGTREIRISLAITMTLLVVINFIIFWVPELAKTIPVSFVTLGVLTLGCAHLPVQELVELHGTSDNPDGGHSGGKTPPKSPNSPEGDDGLVVETAIDSAT